MVSWIGGEGIVENGNYEIKNLILDYEKFEVERLLDFFFIIFFFFRILLGLRVCENRDIMSDVVNRL